MPTPLDLSLSQGIDFNQPIHFRQTSDLFGVKSIDYASQIINVWGDMTLTFQAGDTIQLADNAQACDGLYTIVSMTFGVNSTAILVAESIDSSATNSGTIILDMPLDLSVYDISAPWFVSQNSTDAVIVEGQPVVFTVDETDASLGIIVLVLGFAQIAFIANGRYFYAVIFTIGVNTYCFVNGPIVLSNQGVSGPNGPVTVLVRRSL